MLHKHKVTILTILHYAIHHLHNTTSIFHPVLRIINNGKVEKCITDNIYLLYTLTLFFSYFALHNQIIITPTVKYNIISIDFHPVFLLIYQHLTALKDKTPLIPHHPPYRNSFLHPVLRIIESQTRHKARLTPFLLLTLFFSYLARRFHQKRNSKTSHCINKPTFHPVLRIVDLC